jgi:hypothetical protein
MKVKYRITILIILSIFFFIVSPLLILWTLGYRYNPKKFTFEKTGLLIVKTNPEKADIYLNNKKQKQQTPAKISHLLPNIYNLRIKKSGFLPYEKEITIKSGLTTFVDNVLLFKQNLPILMTEEELEKLQLTKKSTPTIIEKIDTSFLPDDYQNYTLENIIDSYLIFKNPSKTKLLVFDKNNKEIVFNDTGVDIVFNKNKDEFIIYDEFEINLYNKKGEKYFINRSSKKIKNVFFLEDAYILYALEDGIYATEKQPIDLERTTIQLTPFDKIESVILDDKQENLYIFGEINNKEGVYKFNFR